MTLCFAKYIINMTSKHMDICSSTLTIKTQLKLSKAVGNDYLLTGASVFPKDEFLPGFLIPSGQY